MNGFSNLFNIIKNKKITVFLTPSYTVTQNENCGYWSIIWTLAILLIIIILGLVLIRILFHNKTK